MRDFGPVLTKTGRFLRDYKSANSQGDVDVLLRWPLFMDTLLLPRFFMAYQRLCPSTGIIFDIPEVTPGSHKLGEYSSAVLKFILDLTTN